MLKSLVSALDQQCSQSCPCNLGCYQREAEIGIFSQRLAHQQHRPVSVANEGPRAATEQRLAQLRAPIRTQHHEIGPTGSSGGGKQPRRGGAVRYVRLIHDLSARGQMLNDFCDLAPREIIGWRVPHPVRVPTPLLGEHPPCPPRSNVAGTWLSKDASAGRFLRGACFVLRATINTTPRVLRPWHHRARPRLPLRAAAGSRAA